MSEYNIYWTDLHANLHHEQMNELDTWINHIEKNLDFGAFAYYPYYHKKYMNTDLYVEDIYSDEIIKEDWEVIKESINKSNTLFFLGYEWQGTGKDGDHNVFFKNDGYPIFPLTYKELYRGLKNEEVIAIPHHLAYQKGYRGKNWETNIEEFSPLVEIYSSHGSSENDYGPLKMNTHKHMGPRSGQNSVEEGLKRGNRFGIIASGDNHICPGAYKNGLCAVLSKSNSREDIWEALKAKRTYGVSSDRIKLDFKIDDSYMGESINENEKSDLYFNIEGSDDIDRVEVIADNEVLSTILVKKENINKDEDKVRFKFKLELGWGPDNRTFHNINMKNWKGILKTKGKILSIENCWNNMGQSIKKISDKECEFNVNTYKNSDSNIWMGKKNEDQEGFIFEIECDPKDSIYLKINGKEIVIPVMDIIENSMVVPFIDEAKELLKNTFGLEDYYREEIFWRNSYKVKIHRASLSNNYIFKKNTSINTVGKSNIRLRVWQRNGAIAWSSPIFIGEE